MLKVSILKQGEYAIAAIQQRFTEAEAVELRDALAAHVGQHRSKGVILDVAALDVIDTFGIRTIRELIQTVRLRGARIVVAGIQPKVALAMAQLGLELGDAETALDCEEALENMNAEAKQAISRKRWSE